MRKYQTDLTKLRADLAAALGSDGIIDDAAGVQEFCDPFEGPGAIEHQPSFVVQPETVEEVQAVLRIVRERGAHLWTSSMGRNFGYGGSAPVVNGAVILNLRRMNRILDIDVKNGFAMVEPGVTFLQLYEELQRIDAPLMMSVPDLGWGSMIGNGLEHGLGYNILGDHASAMCGFEVVLPSGDVLRTGQGAIPGSPLWACHKRGFGPSLDDLFKQSNFGVVTKAGIWLAPRPDVFLTGTITCNGERDLAALIDIIAPLLREGTVQGVPMVVGNPPDASGGCGEFTQARLKQILRPGRWSVRLGLYGDEVMVAARKSVIENAVKTIPGAVLELRRYDGAAGPDDVEPRDYIAAGIPNMVLLDRLKAAFGEKLGHTDFSPVLPLDGETALRTEKIVKEVMGKHNLIGAFGVLLMARSMVAPCMIFFDASDDARVAAAKAAVREMHVRIAEMGYGLYRSHIDLADDVAARYDFGDGAMSRVYTRIKDALDPSGVLSPGNHGIWPSTYIDQ